MSLPEERKIGRLMCSLEGVKRVKEIAGRPVIWEKGTARFDNYAHNLLSVLDRKGENLSQKKKNSEGKKYGGGGSGLEMGKKRGGRANKGLSARSRLGHIEEGSVIGVKNGPRK